jgi:hypothetical protein
MQERNDVDPASQGSVNTTKDGLVIADDQQLELGGCS